jgi:hypothetical protein
MSFQSEDAIFEQEKLSIYQSLSFSYVQSLFDVFCHKRNQKRNQVPIIHSRHFNGAD